MRIGVVGSRDYPHLDDVGRLIAIIASDRPTATIVSGGAIGVDALAEKAALDLGLTVTSFRVYQTSLMSFGIEEWTLGGYDANVRKMVEEPTFETYAMALNYRNALIAERANRLVAFWAGRTRGTSLTIDFAKAYGRPTTIYTDRKRLP